MSVDYDFNFTEGLYRAKIKTTYKRSDMSMNDSIYSNYYLFESIAFPDISNLEDYTNVTKGYSSWSPILSYSNGINYLSLYGQTNTWERLSYKLQLIQGQQYKITFSYRTISNIRVTHGSKRTLVSDIDPATVPNGETWSVFPNPLGYVDITNNTASGIWVKYEINFIAAENNYLVFAFDAEEDYQWWYEQFKDIKINKEGAIDG